MAIAPVFTGKPILIRASDFRWLDLCHRRLWLNAYRDLSEREELPDRMTIRMERGVQHEAAVHAATAPEVQRFRIKTWRDGVKLTRKAMKQGVSSIWDAYLEYTIRLPGIRRLVKVVGRVDCLEKIAPDIDTPNAQARYAPIEIKQYGSIARDDELQLDCYLWLLEQIQGPGASGQFWLGRDEADLPATRIVYQYDPERFRTALTELASLLNDHDREPPIQIESHCRGCQWFSDCAGEIKKLPRLPVMAIEQLRLKGITRLDQFVTLPAAELRTIKGIKSTAEGHLAQAQAFLQDRPVWFNRFPEHLSQGGWMFDLETVLPSQQEVWSIGWGNTAGNVSVVLVAPQEQRDSLTLDDGTTIYFARDASDAWDRFAQFVVANDLPLFHWTPYDSSHLKYYAPSSVKGLLEKRLHDLANSFQKTVRLPLLSSSLKDTAPYLGFGWSHHEDFFGAWTDYRRWLRTGDETLLAQAAAYQRDDVVALQVVYAWLKAGEANKQR